MDSMDRKNNTADEKKDKKEQTKKPYSPPKLICYGNVVDLTQGTSSKSTEASHRA